MTWNVVTDEGYTHSSHDAEEEAQQECSRANADPEATVVYRVESSDQ